MTVFLPKLERDVDPPPTPRTPEETRTCVGLCETSWRLPEFSMAFQPIVDLKAERVVAYEALVRGPAGEPAATILDCSPPELRYIVDQGCRVKAIEMAVSLGLLSGDADLCINFDPNAVYEPLPCLAKTISAARSAGLPLERVIFEITERERLRDPEHLKVIIREYRSQGLRTAIDDFGAGFAGLSMLAAFQPDIIKIDIALTAKVQERQTSQVIVKAISQICRDLDLQLVAEGVEEEPQVDTLRHLGVQCMQGNYFAAPAFEALPVWPR